MGALSEVWVDWKQNQIIGGSPKYFHHKNIRSPDSTWCLCCPAVSDRSHSYWMMERVCFKQFLGSRILFFHWKYKEKENGPKTSAPAFVIILKNVYIYHWDISRDNLSSLTICLEWALNLTWISLVLYWQSYFYTILWHSYILQCIF